MSTSAVSEHDEVMDTQAVAALLGMGRSYISIMVMNCRYFPRPFKIKGQATKYFFKRREIIAFTEKYALPAELSQAIKRRDQIARGKAVQESTITVDQQLRLNFLRFEYAPPAVKQQLALKKLAAKHAPPALRKRVQVGFILL